MLLSERVQSKVIRLRLDAIALQCHADKYTPKSKVGDTKQKSGKTYVLNENKRWTIAKDQPADTPPAKKKSSSKKKPEPTPDAKKVLEDVKAKVAEEKPKRTRKTKAEVESPKTENKPKKSQKPKTEQVKEPVKQQSTASHGQFQRVAWSEGAKDLDGWQDFHREKATYKKAGEDESARLGDNYAIITGIQRDKSAPKDFRGIRDSKGHLQAAATVKKQGNAFYVGFLATAPWNVAKTRKDDRGMKGAGTAMLVDIARESLANKTTKGRVRLKSLSGAESFYEKMGFQRRGDSYELSPENAKKLVESYDAKFKA